MAASEGPFTSCLKDVPPSTAMTIGWQFTGSAFTLEIRKWCFRHLPFQKETMFDFKFHRRKNASITKTSGDAFLEWFTRCGEALHGSVREFLGVRYFRPLESKGSVKIAVPSTDVNGP